METDIPDYDMDSEDEQWINSQAGKLELTPDKVLSSLSLFAHIIIVYLFELNE